MNEKRKDPKAPRRKEIFIILGFELDTVIFRQYLARNSSLW
jgi:hypothetical protein